MKHHFFMKTFEHTSTPEAQMCSHVVQAHVWDETCACAFTLGLVHAHVCFDLYENWFGSPSLSYELEFKI